MILMEMWHNDKTLIKPYGTVKPADLTDMHFSDASKVNDSYKIIAVFKKQE
jgi:hypothetical protein